MTSENHFNKVLCFKHKMPPANIKNSQFTSPPDDGKLHKAINANDKMHIIEEMTLFADPQPVQHIELDPQRVSH